MFTNEQWLTISNDYSYYNEKILMGILEMNKEIKVIIKGEITENLKKKFNKRLAIALKLKYGREAIDYILKEVSKWRR